MQLSPFTGLFRFTKNQASPSFFGFRRQSRFMLDFHLVKSPSDGGFRDASSSAPLCDGVCFSVSSNSAALPSVVCLSEVASPSTVLLRVSKAVVDAVYGIPGWPIAHVFYKIIKSVLPLPFWTNANSSSAVVHKLFM